MQVSWLELPLGVLLLGCLLAAPVTLLLLIRRRHLRCNWGWDMRYVVLRRHDWCAVGLLNLHSRHGLW